MFSFEVFCRKHKWGIFFWRKTVHYNKISIKWRHIYHPTTSHQSLRMSQSDSDSDPDYVEGEGENKEDSGQDSEGETDEEGREEEDSGRPWTRSRGPPPPPPENEVHFPDYSDAQMMDITTPKTLEEMEVGTKMNEYIFSISVFRKNVIPDRNTVLGIGFMFKTFTWIRRALATFYVMATLEDKAIWDDGEVFSRINGLNFVNLFISNEEKSKKCLYILSTKDSPLTPLFTDIFFKIKFCTFSRSKSLCHRTMRQPNAMHAD